MPLEAKKDLEIHCSRTIKEDLLTEPSIHLVIYIVIILFFIRLPPSFFFIVSIGLYLLYNISFGINYLNTGLESYIV